MNFNDLINLIPRSGSFPPLIGKYDKLGIYSLGVENKNSENISISVSCIDMPQDLFEGLLTNSSERIKEFKTFLVNPLKRTV